MVKVLFTKSTARMNDRKSNDFSISHTVRGREINETCFGASYTLD